jgi:fructokinase
MTRAAVVSIGEILWDLLPGGEFIGGAPFNVAAHVARLGTHSLLVSRVGDDQRGQAAMRVAAQLGVDTSLIQIDAVYPTGVAQASLELDGSARYIFPHPAAWDAIEAPPEAVASTRAADAIIYGMLSQRSECARPAIRQLIDAGRFRVFDPNFRSPDVDSELFMWGLAQANLAKLNDEECQMISSWLGCGTEPERLRVALMQHARLDALCITRGSQGALLYWSGQWHEQPAIPAKVADTVGAGDAFLAMLIVSLLKGDSPQAALLYASRLAAFVVSCSGAVPVYEPHTFRS